MRKKILLVDDEPMLREMLKDFFEFDGFEVTEANDGKEALALIKIHSFDCVVSDIRMPGGDGVELAKNLGELKGAKPPLIFMTGFSDISETAAKTLGVLKIISKPFLPDELMHAVRFALREASHP